MQLVSKLNKLQLLAEPEIIGKLHSAWETGSLEPLFIVLTGGIL